MGLLRGSVTPDAIYRGPIAADKVYRGTVEVWSAYVAPTYDVWNTFDGGSDGADITIANSGGGSGTPVDLTSDTPPKYATADAQSGLSAACLQSGYSYLSWDITPTGVVSLRVWFRPTAVAGTDFQRIIALRLVDATITGFDYRSTGGIRLLQGTSGVSGTEIPLNIGAWNELVLAADLTTGAYTFAAYSAAGGELGSFTGTFSPPATSVDNFRLGGHTSSTNIGGPYNFDGMRLNYSDQVIPPEGPPPSSGKPDASNTGTSGVLTPSAGDFIADQEGAVIENLDITGIISVRVANLTIRNCRIRGDGAGSSGAGLINCAREAVTGTIIIEDCELAPDTPSIDWNGVVGHNFTARRNNIHSVVDGFGVWNLFAETSSAQVTIEDNYVHDAHCWTPDPNHGDNRTHNDGVQIHTGGGVTITGNNFDWTPGATSEPTLTQTYACLMLNGDGQMNPVTVSDNWLTGGTAIINGADTGPTYTLNITGNRFTNPDAGYFMLLATQHTCPGLPTSTGPDTNNGNVNDADDTPVTVTRQ